MATDDQLRGIRAKLELKLSTLNARIVTETDSLDFTDVATSAIIDALVNIPGALDVASRMVSGTLFQGLGDTFDKHTDAIDTQVGGGGGSGWDYTAVMDGATSFPPGQMIETDRGSKAVENVTEFDLIRTPAGWERPTGFGAFPFAGYLMEFRTASGRSITVTHDHRLRAAVGSGDCDWETAEALFEHMAHVENVALSHPDQLPPLEDGSLTALGFAAERMPERPIGLDRDLVGDDEIDAPPCPESDLFLVAHLELVEGASHREFKHRPRGGLLTARERAEVTLAVIREQRSAHAALQLGTPGTLEAGGTAPMAQTLRARDDERVPTLRTRKLNPLSRVAARHRAEPVLRRPDRIAALHARRGWRRVSSFLLPLDPPALLRCAGGATVTVSASKGSAIGASDGEGIHDRIIQSSRRWYEGYVYDLTTPSGALVVNGLVVHNCDVCAAWDGTHFDTWEEIAGPDGPLPDGGPNTDCLGTDRCRCRAAIA